MRNPTSKFLTNLKLAYDKYYIISSPCQGKTTFIRKHKGRYGKYNLYDCDDMIDKGPRCLKNLPPQSVVFSNLYYPVTNSHTVMGKCIIVRIPLEKLLSNLAHRQKNSQPYKWSCEHTVLNYYNRLDVLIDRGNIPVFDCFEQAMEFVVLGGLAQKINSINTTETGESQ